MSDISAVFSLPALEDAIAKAVLAERERCANIAEEKAARFGGDYSASALIASKIAEEIRKGE